MTYDTTTVKGFPILLEASLNILAQGQIFVFPLAHNSKNKLNVKSNNMFGSSFWKYFNA